MHTYTKTFAQRSIYLKQKHPKQASKELTFWIGNDVHKRFVLWTENNTNWLQMVYWRTDWPLGADQGDVPTAHMAYPAGYIELP